MHGRATRDADLVARAKEGDLDAFERLIARHRTRLLDLARRMVGEREAAQDIVQEALLRAFRFLPSLREGDRFGPWLNTIVRRLCQQWLRDGPRRPEPVDGEMLQGAPVVLWGRQPETPGEVVERVRAALAVLSQRERRVMILHYLEGLSCEEIARALGIRNASVRRILHYSRRKVRKEAEMAKQAETAKRGLRACPRSPSSGPEAGLAALCSRSLLGPGQRQFGRGPRRRAWKIDTGWLVLLE